MARRGGSRSRRDDGGGAPLDEYEVLSAAAGAPGEALYRVRLKRTDGPTFRWRAKRLPAAAIARVDELREGARALADALRPLEEPHLVKLLSATVHAASRTLYVVTDDFDAPSLERLVERCRTERVRFDESFAWAVMYGIVSVRESLRNVDASGWRKLYDASRVYVDDERDVRLDPFCPVLDESSSEMSSSDARAIGELVFEMCTLEKYDETKSYAFEYSRELREIVFGLLNDETNGRALACDVLLYHPIVLSHLDGSKRMFVENSVPQPKTSTPAADSAFESDESRKSNSLKLTFLDRTDEHCFIENVSMIRFSPSMIALDLELPGYVPKVCRESAKKRTSRLDLCREPREVSESALSKVWLERLETLCRREEALKLKEKEIAKTKLFDEIRSKILLDEGNTASSKDELVIEPGITLQTAMTDKILNVDNKNENKNLHECKSVSICSESIVNENKRLYSLPKRCSRRSGCAKTRKKKMAMNYEDMNSSLSADPGDTSIIQTSSKLSAELVPRPYIISNQPRKKVHFTSRNNPFAEYDNVSSTTLTFFNNSDSDLSYEVPIKLSSKPENVAEKIAKFTYLDLEEMTNKKRALMNEWRKTSLETKRISNVNMESKLNVQNKNKTSSQEIIHLKNESDTNAVEQSVLSKKRKSRKSKYSSPKLFSSSSQTNIYTSNSESSSVSTISYPCAGKLKDRRKSMPLPFSNVNLSIPNIKAISTIKNVFVSDNERMTRSKSLRSTPGTRIFETKLSLPIDKSKQVSDSFDNVSARTRSGNKENCNTPAKIKEKSRRSILGFKTPFKLNI